MNGRKWTQMDTKFAHFTYKNLYTPVLEYKKILFYFPKKILYNYTYWNEIWHCVHIACGNNKTNFRHPKPKIVSRACDLTRPFFVYQPLTLS